MESTKILKLRLLVYHHKFETNQVIKIFLFYFLFIYTTLLFTLDRKVC